jgi:hypothetical protein
MVNGHEMVQESNNQGSEGLKAHRNDYREELKSLADFIYESMGEKK